MHVQLQEPVTVQLGSLMTSGPRGQMHEHKDSFQYIPLDRGLKALLKNNELCDEVCLYTFICTKMHYFSA